MSRRGGTTRWWLAPAPRSSACGSGSPPCRTASRWPPDAMTASSQALDLTACDREPIHVLGAIQPHGLLVTLDGPDLAVV
ncbi:MAG TPA: hypothetical protein VEA41_17065, partial [Salinarimonas sp.]|nr:hypothetical protein [Salinarimonas sp.]